MILYRSDDRENEKNTLYLHAEKITSLSDFKKVVQFDHMSSKMKDNRRSLDNFLECDCIMFDIDNTHSEEAGNWKSKGDIEEALPFNLMLVQSRNYMKEKRKTSKKGEVTVYAPREKWHVYAPLKKPIRTTKEHAALMKNVLSVFPFIDPSAIDSARFFYGVEKPHVEAIEGGCYVDEYFSPIDKEELKRNQVEAITDFENKVNDGTYKDDKSTRNVIKIVRDFLGISGPPLDLKESNASIDNDCLDWIKTAEQNRSLTWLEGWANKYGVELGKRYSFNQENHPNAVAICVTCPWEEEHSEDGAENEAVIIIELSGQYDFLCRHTHSGLLNWKKYRAKCETEAREKGIVQDDTQEAKAAVTTENGILKPVESHKNVAELKPVSAQELLAQDFPALNWIVRDLLPEGVAILSAPPKSYKSFMMMDLCVQACIGGSFLGHQCTQTHALYLDLESGQRRTQSRLKMVLPDGEAPPNGLYFLNILDDVQPLKNGFEQQIRGVLDKDNQLKLIVVDVFKKIKPNAKRGQNAYDADYEALQPLSQITGEYPGLCLVIVTHDRKMKDTSDWTNNMSGSTGLTAAVDVILRIDRESRDSDISTLQVTGREIEPQELKMQFNKMTMRWDYLGTAEEVRKKAFRNDYAESSVIAAIKKGLEVYDGSYSTTLKNLITDSEYWGVAIYGKSTQAIAREISKYKTLLELDNIVYKATRQKERIYHFTYQVDFEASIEEFESLPQKSS